MKFLSLPQNVSDWRLFIDSSKYTLKAVLLHNGNLYRSIPVLYARNIKESYDSMGQILDLIDYNKCQWQICGNLKVIAFLLGLQQGFTKFSCFLCEWNSRARAEHYSSKVWPPRVQFKIGEKI